MNDLTLAQAFGVTCKMYFELVKDLVHQMNWNQLTGVFIASTMLVKLPFFAYYMIVHYKYTPIKLSIEDGPKDLIKVWAIVGVALATGAAAFFNCFEVGHIPLLHHEMVSQIGSVLAVVSLIGTVWTHWALGASWSGIVTVQKNHTLRVTGPYKLCRHPMYLTCILHCIAVALMSQNWLMTLIFSAPMALITRRVPQEEQLMIEVFGQQYVDYKHSVGAFLPWPGGAMDYGLTEEQCQEALKKREEALKDKKE